MMEKGRKNVLLHLSRYQVMCHLLSLPDYFAAIVLDHPITSSVIPIRQVPSAPAVYTLPRHGSTSHLDQKRPASPKKNRRFSFMPGSKKDTSFVRSPLRHSLRELSSRKKQQSGSLPDFTQFTVGKNKNLNFNNSNNVDTDTNLSITIRIPVPNPPLEEFNSNNDDDGKDGDDDLMHTHSETSLTPSTSLLGDNNLEQPLVMQRRSSSSNNLSGTDVKQKPTLRDSTVGFNHRHLLARGLCFGSYSLFNKGTK